jgi:glycosyltransferase involved in cell wall biosynthesis
MTPLLSILIPCHNAAPWLAATLDSALAQTVTSREIVVVDDGSTDASLSIARQFESRGVRVIAQPNRGASAARNHALNIASGAYIQFLDADDLLAPEKIEGQLTRLRAAGDRQIASCAWARFAHAPAEAVFTPDPAWRDMSGVEFQLLHYETGWMMQPACWLCPRPLLDAIGPWNESLSLNDDGEYFSRVMLASSGILFCGAARVYYRSGLRHSLSRRKDRRALESLWRVTELNCTRLLQFSGNTPRAHGAAANGWQWLAFECYPTAPDLASAAEARCAVLGGSPFPFPAGRNFHRLARLVGWRAAKRLRHLTDRD